MIEMVEKRFIMMKIKEIGKEEMESEISSNGISVVWVWEWVWELEWEEWIEHRRIKKNKWVQD